MASNRIPANTDTLISLAADAAGGAASTGEDIQLAQNTAARIRADLTALTGDPDADPPAPGALNPYNAAKAAKVAATAARVTAEGQARAFAASAVGVLKNYLGTHWSPAWQQAGFTAGSLAIPDDPLSLISEIRACLRARPEWANAPLRITVEAASEVTATLTAARTAANQRVKELGQAKAAQDTARRNLSRRLSGLRAELAQLLSPDDPRWYAFGFDRPGDGWQPAAVEHLVLTPGGPGSLFADWDDTRRAERYKVTRQTGDGPVETVGTGILDSECTLTGLTSGTVVTVTVTAINAAGESPRGASASATVP